MLALLLASPALGETGDINGDSRDDLVLGVPGEDVAAFPDAGFVQILFGRVEGISVVGNEGVTQEDVGGNLELRDRFGNAIAYGDFDGDGRDDVAVGSPGEDYNDAVDTGVVHVLYGAPGGLSTSRTQFISATELGRSSGAGDFLGAVLVAGDLNGDGRDDLAIAAPGVDLRSNVAAGRVFVVLGGSGGLQLGLSLAFDQANGVPSRPESFDGFGASIAIGDLDGDGIGDLAVGVPGESVSGKAAAGVTHVFYGTGAGPSRPGVMLTADLGGIGQIAGGDLYGSALSTGDVDVDGDDELVIGIPGRDSTGVRNAGAFAVVNGGARGAVTGVQLDATTLPGDPVRNAELGFALAVGDYNGDGDADIAAGAPGDRVGGRRKAGLLVVVGGSSSGVSATGALAYSQLGPMPGKPERGDGFGFALRSGDFDNDGFVDLVVGVPYETINGIVQSGQVQVLYGSSSSLSRSRVTSLVQGADGLGGVADVADRLGLAL